MPISMRFPHAHLLPHLRTEALPHQSCIAYVLVGLQLTGIHRFYTQYRANSRLFLSPSTHQALKLEVWGFEIWKSSMVLTLSQAAPTASTTSLFQVTTCQEPVC